MKCKRCLQEKESTEFLSYTNKAGIFRAYKVCKSCYHTALSVANTGFKQSIEHVAKRLATLRRRKLISELDVGKLDTDISDAIAEIKKLDDADKELIEVSVDDLVDVNVEDVEEDYNE